MSYDELEQRVMAGVWPRMEDFIGNGFKRGELVLFTGLHRDPGKSIYERELKLRILKERKPSINPPDVFWFDEMCFLGNQFDFFGISKEFKKKLSTEVLDQPEVPTVEWANFIQKEI